MKRTDKQRVVFRADGDSNMGLGHVYRLLSLVEICQNTFECLFIIKQPGDTLSDLIKSYCSLLPVDKYNEDELITAALLPTDILVLDGYHFDTAFQKKMKGLVQKLVVIDDTASNYFLADVVINHGGEQLKHQYSLEPHTKLLTGFPYLILRKEFLKAARMSRSVSKVDTVFICMGGADPFKVTVKALGACVASQFIKKVIVVTGSAFENKTELSDLVEEGRKKKEIIHEEDVAAEIMVQLIQQSEIAICPSSSVAMEVCCVRAGLLTGMVIDNQSSTHEQLLSAGCAISIGDFNAASTSDIQNLLTQLSQVEIVNNIMKSQAKAINGLSGESLLQEFKLLASC